MLYVLLNAYIFLRSGDFCVDDDNSDNKTNYCSPLMHAHKEVMSHVGPAWLMLISFLYFPAFSSYLTA